MGEKGLPRFECFSDDQPTMDKMVKFVPTIRIRDRAYCGWNNRSSDQAEAKSNATTLGWASCARDFHHFNRNWKRHRLQSCSGHIKCLLRTTSEHDIRPPDLPSDLAETRWDRSASFHTFTKSSECVLAPMLITSLEPDTVVNKSTSTYITANYLRKAKVWT